FGACGQKSLCRRSSSVGHANIHAAKFLYNSFDEVVNRARLSHIKGLSKDVHPGLLANLFRRSLKLLTIARAHSHAASLCSKGFCSRKSNPLAGSRHDRHSAFEASFHSSGL